MRVGPRPIKVCPRLQKGSLRSGAGGALCGLCRCLALGVVGWGWVAFLFGGWRLVWAQGRAPPAPSLRSPSGSFACRGYRVFVLASLASRLRSGLRSGLRLGSFSI